MRQIYAGGLLALLAGCSAVAMQPPDPAMTARIVQACLASGLFKAGVGFGLSFAGPVGKVADQIFAAGVDRVCANPEAYAADASTAEWVAKNLAARL